jgi:hypothetical protein
MILQIRNFVLEFDKKDRNKVLSHIQPEGEELDDACLKFVCENLLESGILVEIHQLKPWKTKGDVVLDWYRGDMSIITFMKGVLGK